MKTRTATSIAIPFLLVLAACASTKEVSTAPAPVDHRLAPDLLVRQLEPRLWVHTSFMEMPKWGLVPSNGLLIEGAHSVTIVDTPFTPAQTAVLLDWVEQQLHKKVTGLVVTHAHDDRMGGIAAAHARGIPTYGIDLTAELAPASGWDKPSHLLPHDGTVQVGESDLEVLFPGHGHAPDNITVWLPAERVLFAGCVVKELASKSLGNLAAAEGGAWAKALETLSARYPEARWVVPGHGEWGDMALVAHTRELIRAREAEVAQ